MLTTRMPARNIALLQVLSEDLNPGHIIDGITISNPFKELSSLFS
jgi:hypothetical protein